ncbi:calcium-binding protein [Mesorhizobium sp. LHD-90]|uniref:calcium-binding protein n=1 Tax=Mesorhizobium sp. LHD-90 TaxID=3071414 RepID=UPI0027DFB7B6|nr:calcium-binding protein [Mesorhizobium sp. LHD-90]MDQ6436872.1 calcium-binding protein [Mesorhizobium sp. LHD-90]
MATLDLTKATASLDMTDPNLVTFGTAGATLPFYFNYLTPAGSSVVLQGENMTYGGGRPVSGTVTKIELDTGAYDANRPELVITGVSLEPQALLAGPDSFWRFLEGNDVITGASLTTARPDAEFKLFGDGISARAGATGGNDIIQPGDANTTAMGDVSQVGSRSTTSALVDYRGGVDDITGAATTAFQSFSGDAEVLFASGKLTGGNDTIYIQSTHAQAMAVGDVVIVEGMKGRVAQLIGGNDYIAAGPDFHGTLIGDAAAQNSDTLVYGGDDRIEGGLVRDEIYGDVQYVTGGRLYAGDDRLRGNRGDDVISGDAERIENGARVVGGNDTIYGGEGSDRIYGETAFEDNSVVIVRGDDLIFGEAGEDDIFGQTGNDQLYGGADADRLYGGTGNDFLDGGTGLDTMEGGIGNDVYVVDAIGDVVIEVAGQGTDTVLSFLNSYKLGDNFEKLTSLATGDFIGIGNDLANVIETGAGKDAIGGRGGNDVLISGSGDDQLHGEAGNDVLDGGAGRDRLEGGDGFDTISYASADKGVRFALDGAFAGTGDAEGDNQLGVEAVVGSNFGDVLRGDSGINKLEGRGGNDAISGGAGNDVIVGGAGKDTLSSGTGNDRFDYLALSDGGDTIREFRNSTGNNDALRFEGDVFGGLANGALAAKYFVANATGVATTLDQRFVYETDTGILRYDANGSAAGGVTVIATLTGAPGLTAGDFFII